MASRARTLGFQKSFVKTSVPTRMLGAASYAATRADQIPPELPKWSQTVIVENPAASVDFTSSSHARRVGEIAKSVLPNRKVRGIVLRSYLLKRFRKGRG